MRIIVLSISIVFLSVVFFYVMHLPVFQIKSISVSSNDKSSYTNSIKELVANKITSNNIIREFLFGKKNALVATIYSKSMLKDIYNNYTSIKSASISYNKSNHSLNIKIEEKKKYGIFCVGFDKNKCFWFDKAGMLFIKSPDTEGRLIRKIIDISPTTASSTIGVGDNIFTKYRMGIVRKIFSFLNASGLHIKTLLLRNRKLEEIETYNKNYPKIYFSLRYDPFFAMPGLQKIYNKLKNYSYIDLRVKNRIYYK